MAQRPNYPPPDPFKPEPISLWAACPDHTKVPLQNLNRDGTLTEKKVGTRFSSTHFADAASTSSKSRIPTRLTCSTLPSPPHTIPVIHRHPIGSFTMRTDLLFQRTSYLTIRSTMAILMGKNGTKASLPTRVLSRSSVISSANITGSSLTSIPKSVASLTPSRTLPAGENTIVIYTARPRPQRRLPWIARKAKRL